MTGGAILLRDRRPARSTSRRWTRAGRDIRAIRGRRIGLDLPGADELAVAGAHHRLADRRGDQAAHARWAGGSAQQRAIELLRQVEIPDPERMIDRYTFEFSGGMRQRAMIAMALACDPDILIADEPTTALDVTTQAEILDLVKRLQVERGMAMLLITHDIGVVAEVADEVAVMRFGRIVEQGTVDAIFHRPQHPYTRRLLASTAKLEAARGERARGRGRRRRRSSPSAAWARSMAALPRAFRQRPLPLRAVDDASFDLLPAKISASSARAAPARPRSAAWCCAPSSQRAARVTYRDRDGREVEVDGPRQARACAASTARSGWCSRTRSPRSTRA